MIRTRPPLLAALLACALAGVVSASAQEAPPVTAEIEAARRLVADGKWKEGKAALEQVLATRAGDMTVVSNLTRIEEDLQRCGYRLAVPADPRAIFALAPVKYDPVTRAAEFRGAGFPPFEDEATLELEWKKGETAAVPPDIVVRIGDGRLSFGIKVNAAPGTGGVRTSVEIHQLTPRPSRLLDQSAPRGMDASRLVTGKMEVEITPKLTRVLVNGYEMGRTGPLPRREAASIGVGPAQGAAPAEMRVVMKVDREFARAAAQEAEEKGVLAWAEKSWDRAKALPRWAVDAQGYLLGQLTAFPPGESGQGDFEEARQTLLDHYENTEKSKLHAQTVKRMPPLLRRHISSLAALRSGELRDAEEGFLEVTHGAPSYVPAQVGLARVQFERGRVKEVRQALEETRTAGQRFAPWYELAADMSLLDGDAPRAMALLDEAIGRGIASECTLRMAEALRARDTGPAWPRAAKHASARLDVTGDVDAKTCQEIAAIAESAIDDSAATLGPWPATRRGRIFVFSDERAFRAWDGAFGDDRRPAPARYIVPLRHLVVLAGRDTAKLRRHVRHETFRMALDGLVREPPAWLAEGFASASGCTLPDAEEGWLRGDAEPRNLLVSVARSDFVPLRDLFLSGRGAFRDWDTALPRHLQAWTVAEMFRRTGDPALAALPKRTVDELVAGATRDAAFVKVLGPALPKLEAAWRAHLDGLGK